jgi:hypothetical protein
MPNVPHIDLGLAKNYAVAKIKDAVIAAAGRWETSPNHKGARHRRVPC